MSERPLRCTACGAVWVSPPALELMARISCLRCDGPLEQIDWPQAQDEGATAEPGQGPRTEQEPDYRD